MMHEICCKTCLSLDAPALLYLEACVASHCCTVRYCTFDTLTVGMISIIDLQSVTLREIRLHKPTGEWYKGKRWGKRIAPYHARHQPPSSTNYQPPFRSNHCAELVLFISLIRCNGAPSQPTNGSTSIKHCASSQQAWRCRRVVKFHTGTVALGPFSKAVPSATSARELQSHGMVLVSGLCV